MALTTNIAFFSGGECGSTINILQSIVLQIGARRIKPSFIF